MSEISQYREQVERVPASLEEAKKELAEVEAKEIYGWYEQDRETWLRGYLAGREKEEE